MQFQIEDVSYSVARFFDIYQNKLPMVVMVTQGFCGDVIEDTFDREEVMIINAVSRQERVVGECVLHGVLRLLSLPEDYTEKLCKIKNGIVEEEAPINKILRSNTLPLWIQFPCDHVISFGNRSINTNHIPPWRLIKRFEEIYLLGNTLIDGQLCTDVTHVPLYLSQLRLSVVKGIKGQSLDRWRVYFDNLVYKCGTIEYDKHYGNQNIAEYDQSAIHSTSKMSYTQPKSYSSIVSLVEGPSLKSRLHLHVPLSGDRKQETSSKASIHARPLPPLPEDIPKGSLLKTDDANATELSDKVSNMYITPEYKMETNSKKSAYFDLPKRSSPEPDYDQREETEELKSTDAMPPAPRPRYIFPKPTASKHRQTSEYPEENRSNDTRHSSDQKIEISPKYDNDIPRATLTPTLSGHVRNSQEVPTVTIPDRGFKRLEYRHTKDSISNVESLSIHEVAEYLRVLNLGQYAEMFRNHMIDGMILIGLSEKMLREDFGMNGVEAFRLLKFAKEGYIPT